MNFVIYLFIPFFMNLPTGQTCPQIFTLDGSNESDSRKDVPFGGFVDIAPHFGCEMPPNPNLWGVNRRFQAKRAKYLKFHVIETTASSLTKFGITIETINRPPINPRWQTAVILKKNPLNRHISATVRPILMKFGTVHGDASWPLAADQPLKF